MHFLCPKPTHIQSHKGPCDGWWGSPRQGDVLAALKFGSFHRAGPDQEFRGLCCLMKCSGAVFI